MNNTQNSWPDWQPRSIAIKRLRPRTFIHQCTDIEGLDNALTEGPAPIYLGFDATADSLHVGSLVPVMMMRNLQRAGHKPIILVGGGTSRIGDPSFRKDSRPMLSDADIQRNIDGIRKVFGKFLTFGDGPTDAVLVNNAEWLDELNYIDMLRDIGRHFSINRMIGFDNVKTRLENQQNLSFLEFNYMILQAYDFLELHRRFGCVAQLGGSDQWANIINGVDLVRKITGKTVFGLTTPLLTTATGAKMGKTADGAVWVNDDRLPAFDYWQFWRNCADEDVGRFLRIFTDLNLETIEDLEALRGSEINSAKKVLASHATALNHGMEAALKAERAAQDVFEGSATGNDLPVINIDLDDSRNGLSLADLLVLSGLSKTKSEGRRLIRGGGARLDGSVISDEKAVLGPDILFAGSSLRLSAGRKRHALIQVG
ncbi:tyrosine--tRNA ligase [Aestuariispira insulae]|uniref:Tyrosine--tRNA ligase n=1 Tax=Aestuariispira insulae TaxID=1461337 RepID=A0A3D9HWL3_9PROT|nr:tyrosine--tRNA ligase [Aestuariispira insulae]RED53805.1 tyrosyl-tRNA synthetase [Aestuariispira insulae]